MTRKVCDERTYLIVNHAEYEKLFWDTSIPVGEVQRIALANGYIIPKEQVGEA
jgi:hypothetical protein